MLFRGAAGSRGHGRTQALRIALLAMLVVCIGLYALNHSGEHRPALRWTIASLTVLSVMIESGFTPAALSLLAGSMGAIAGRGATMGIYSVLLSVGAILGSLLAAVLGQRFAVDGLIYGTFALALISLWSMARLPRSQGLSEAASK